MSESQTAEDGRKDAACQDPYASLRELRTQLRPDLQVTRQATRDGVVYVVFEPVGFRAHRLSLDDYRVITSLTETETLQQSFDKLVEEGVLSPNEESDFYRFVARLQKLSLLTASTRSANQLYQANQLRTQASRQNGLSALLFYSFPLADPDRFLTRNARHFRFLFHQTAFWIWLFALTAALSTVMAMRHEFALPLNRILAADQLLFMWLAFLILKVWHELGHGFACKLFGGSIPEMGCKLIVGMPLAYVDVSSVWSFPQRKHRIVVMLAGMYFESLIAIPAVFVWATCPHTLIGAFAYQLVLMAGVATLLFNANPLMRFDGYFVLSELVGIPNLRSRSRAYILHVCKRIVLRLQDSKFDGVKDRKTLFVYGLASLVYVVVLHLSICWLIATRFLFVGVVIAACHLIGLIYQNSKKLWCYLCFDEETRDIRGRSVPLAYAMLIAIPVGIIFLPVPTGLRVSGIVSAEHETVLRTKVPGHLTQIVAEVGETLSPTDALVKLDNMDVRADYRSDTIELSRVVRASRHASRTDMVEATKLRLDAASMHRHWQAVREDASDLTVRAGHAGRLVDVLSEQEIGNYLEPGDQVGKIVWGKTVVRAWLNEEQVRSAALKQGSVSAFA